MKLQPYCGGARLLGLFIFAVSAPLSALPISAETLRSVVDRTIQSHPELAAIRANRHAIDHELTAARGLNLPSLDVKGEFGRRPGWSTNSLGIKTGDNWHRQRTLSAILSQRLFDGFESRHEIARQKNRVESARWRVMDTANSIALRTVQAYLEVQRARAVLSAAMNNVHHHDRLVGRVHRRVSGGHGTVADRSEAVGRAARARALRVEAGARLRDAEALYRSLVGEAPTKLSKVRVPHEAMPRTVNAAVATAVETAPSVLATQHDATAAKATIGSAFSRFFPKVNLELNANQARGTSESSDKSHEMSALVVVRWNLFNGGIDKARKWEAVARAREATEISENTKRIVARETRASWTAIRAAKARVPLLSKELRQAQITRNTYNRQYDGGQRRLLDLLNIQAEIFTADASLRNEHFVQVYNSFRILAATGQLVGALNIDLPLEATTPHAPTLIDGWRDGWNNWTTTITYHRRTKDQ